MIVQRCRNFDLTQDEHHVDNEVMDERFTFLPEVGFPPNRTSILIVNAVLTASLFVVVVGLPQHSLRCRESLLRTPALQFYDTPCAPMEHCEEANSTRGE